MGKRINPRRRPATMQDVRRAKDAGLRSAIRTAMAIFFTVMRDKHGWGIPELKQLWDEVNDLSDSVTKGYCTVDDLCKTLYEESDIFIK